MSRIAYVVHTFDIGGLERCIAQLSTELENEFKPIVVCINRNGSAAQWLPDTIPIFELNKKDGHDRSIGRRLARFFSDNDISIAQSHNWGTLLETQKACNLTDAKQLHAVHGQELDRYRVSGMKKLLRAFLMRQALKKTSKIVACAEVVKESIVKNCYISPSLIDVIPNGVVDASTAIHKDDRLEVRKTLNVPNNAFVFGSVGRLVSLKGFELAISALDLLVKRELDAHFVLIGDGPELQRLRNKVTQLSLEERVHFCGWQANPQKWLGSLDVYVNTSHTEAMNMGILEALSIGLPVVASDVGDNKIMLSDHEMSVDAGMIFSPGEHSDLAVKLENLARDKDLRIRIGDRARHRFEERYTLSTMVASYRARYLAI